MNRQLFEYSYALKKEKKKRFFFVILYFILVILIINVILKFIIFPVRQVSSSMIPDIQEQSIVMVVPFLKNAGERGDVVLVDSQNSIEYTKSKKLLKGAVAFLTGQQVQLFENKDYPGTKQHLRRIIGVPGDTVYMRDYVLYIKPAGDKHFLTEFEVIKNDYNVTFYTAPANWDSSIGVKGSFEEILLKEDEYFVLGDNRKDAADSRLWGPVKASAIDGKAVFCYFPLKNWKVY